MSKISSIIDFFTGIPTYSKAKNTAKVASAKANKANQNVNNYINKSNAKVERLKNEALHNYQYMQEFDNALIDLEHTGDYRAFYDFLMKNLSGDEATKLSKLNSWFGTNFKNFNDFMLDSATGHLRKASDYRQLLRPAVEDAYKRSEDAYTAISTKAPNFINKLNTKYLNAQAAADQARVLQNKAGRRALAHSGTTALGTGVVGGGSAIAVNSAMDTPNEHILDNAETPSIPASTPTPEQALTVPEESIKEDPAWYTKWLETNAPEWYKTFQNTLANPVMPPSTQTSTGLGTPVKDSTFMDKLLNFGFPLLTGSIKGSLNGINDLLINTGLGIGELTKSFWDSFKDSNTTPLSTNTAATEPTPQSTPVITEEPKESIVQSQETPVKEPVVETPPVVSSSKPAPSAPPVKQSGNIPQTVVNTPTEADVASAMVKKAVTPQVLQYGSPYYLQKNKPVDMRQWVRQKYGMSQSPAELVQRGIMPYEYLQYW